jgi:hypothetical protein
MVIGGGGAISSETTHAERSKSMNSRIFSCGERFPGAGLHVPFDVAVVAVGSE